MCQSQRPHKNELTEATDPSLPGARTTYPSNASNADQLPPEALPEQRTIANAVSPPHRTYGQPALTSSPDEPLLAQKLDAASQLSGIKERQALRYTRPPRSSYLLIKSDVRFPVNVGQVVFLPCRQPSCPCFNRSRVPLTRARADPHTKGLTRHTKEPHLTTTGGVVLYPSFAPVLCATLSADPPKKI